MRVNPSLDAPSEAHDEEKPQARLYFTAEDAKKMPEGQAFELTGEGCLKAALSTDIFVHTDCQAETRAFAAQMNDVHVRMLRQLQERLQRPYEEFRIHSQTIVLRPETTTLTFDLSNPDECKAYIALLKK